MNTTAKRKGISADISPDIDEDSENDITIISNGIGVNAGRDRHISTKRRHVGSDSTESMAQCEVKVVGKRKRKNRDQAARSNGNAPGNRVSATAGFPRLPTMRSANSGHLTASSTNATPPVFTTLPNIPIDYTLTSESYGQYLANFGVSESDNAVRGNDEQDVYLATQNLVNRGTTGWIDDASSPRQEPVANNYSLGYDNNLPSGYADDDMEYSSDDTEFESDLEESSAENRASTSASAHTFPANGQLSWAPFDDSSLTEMKGSSHRSEPSLNSMAMQSLYLTTPPNNNTSRQYICISHPEGSTNDKQNSGGDATADADFVCDVEDEPMMGVPRKKRVTPKKLSPNVLEFYVDEWRLIIQSAQWSVCLYIATENGFPSKKELDSKISGFLNTAIHEFRSKNGGRLPPAGYYEKYRKNMLRLIRGIIAVFRGELKGVGKRYVREYGFIPKKKMSRDAFAACIAKEIKKLIGPKALFLQMGVDENDRKNIFCHFVLRKVCLDFFYSSDSKLGSRFKGFFSESVPVKAMALIGTAVACNLFQYKTGRRKTVKFNYENFRPVYNQMLKIIAKIGKDPYQLSKFEATRVSWAGAGVEKLQENAKANADAEELQNIGEDIEV